MNNSLFDNSWMGTLPLIIAGPCSAESLDQVITTALQLGQNKTVTIYRAGVWKPRTRPGSFEGKGEEALPWLQQVKQQTNLKVATEVALPVHVQECLKHNVDMMWIGARTTVNPIMVQELANALQGVDIPIFIKNPINPDIELWVGAIERFLLAGHRKLAAIHRGFSTSDPKPFRNAPEWSLLKQMQQIFPDLALICDPSHIAGNTQLIYQVCQQALENKMQGLMIESHYNPSQALTDAKQQITPADLSALLQKLNLTQPVS